MKGKEIILVESTAGWRIKRFRYGVRRYIKLRILNTTNESMLKEADIICDAIISELDDDQLRRILHKLLYENGCTN